MRELAFAFIAGFVVRELVHFAIALWEGRKVNQEQAVSAAWRTEHIEETGKSGR